jgi:hypothetical protein
MLGAGCGTGGVEGKIGPLDRGGGGIDSGPEKGPGWVETVDGRLMAVGGALLGRWPGATLPPPQAASTETQSDNAKTTQRTERTGWAVAFGCGTRG